MSLKCTVRHFVTGATVGPLCVAQISWIALAFGANLRFEKTKTILTKI